MSQYLPRGDIKGMIVPSQQYINTNQLAKLTGVTPRTIRRWLSAGTLPRPYRINSRTLRWEVEEIHEWLKSTRSDSALRERQDNEIT